MSCLRRKAPAFALSALSAALVFGAPARSVADAPTTPIVSDELAPLLARLARHAEQFEQMKRRASFTMSGKMEELDSKGKIDATKEMVIRSTATPTKRLNEIVRYVEDGADKTDEARKKAERGEKKKSARDDLKLPFLASEQPSYMFSVAERDPATPGRVRIVFNPRTPTEKNYKGSAWIDESSGEVLTLAFSPGKYPMFVDHMEVTMRFDLKTPLGLAPSSFAFDARGGFLILKKHYRGSAMISDARVAF